MPRDAARVVRLLSIARRPIARAELVGGEAPGGRATPTALESAVASGLVLEHEGRLGPAHELYAEAIEAFELPPERQGFHLALASRPTSHPAECRLALDARRPPA